MKAHKLSWFIYPLAGFLLILLFSFSGPFQSLELRLYDILLATLSSPAEDERILLVEIDDPTIAEVGTYPVGRNVVADGAVHFWENNASYVIFDSEFVDLSPRGVNDSVLTGDIPLTVSSALAEVESFGSGLADALASGQLPADALPDYLDEYRSYTLEMEEQILEGINQIILDKDEYLGQRVSLLNKGIITIGMEDNPDAYVSDELRQSAARFSLSPVEGDLDLPARAVDIRPSIAPISSRAMALGFPRVHIDEDGVRRQIDLIYRWEDMYYPQLGFAVILDLFKPQSYEFRDGSLILKGITHPEKGFMEEFAIPLSKEGKMMINWPHSTFLESFRHLSFLKLLVHDLYIKNIRQNLEQLESWGLMAMYAGENPLDYFYYADEYLAQALSASESGDVSFTGEEYRLIRDAALQSVLGLTDSSLERDGTREITRLIEHPDFPVDQKDSLTGLLVALPELMSALEEINTETIALREEIYGDIGDAIIILGYTGASTQDIGVTPFENRYMNMGLHGAVINTVLQEEFIRRLPAWFSIITAFVLSAVIALILRSKKTLFSLLIAVAVWIAGLSALVLFFRLTLIYPGVMLPLLSSFITSITVLVVKFVLENKEKGFIRNAFGQYLSTDVIDSLLSHPDQLSLGGEEKNLTAIFTDIKGFSTISEQLDPTQLVALLNRYLTTLSDIILDHNGTIDKFEGDAIIAFFGAPHDLKDHARQAVLSALEMKKAEALLNNEFLNSDHPLSPSPLFTRIGINSGPMVVGNMGTQRKMDYTIMGNSVNLAARLEGVNKEYKTWSLCSHFTYEQIKNDVVARALDRVRVVGINEPVQLYNILEEKAFASRALVNQVEMFGEGMKLFIDRKWEASLKSFTRYSDIFPDDETPSVYMERCRNYLKKPPSDNWDGVYNLTKK